MRSLVLIFTLLSISVFAQNDTISVMSWNVFLRPGILKDRQLERVDRISAFLDTSGNDVLVLQEVFHRKARKQLIDSLEKEYPYFSRRGPTSFWGVSSGVLILSKYPIESTEFRAFRHAKGSDALAKKGVMKSRIRIGNQQIDVFGTHLQAGGGEKRKWIRQRQLNSIRQFIGSANDSSIQIIAGDFNISSESEAFDSISRKLDIELPKIRGKFKNTSNFPDHDFMESHGDPKWIDFVFLRRNIKSRVLDAEILEPRIEVEETTERISDHNPIVTRIEIDSGIQR